MSVRSGCPCVESVVGDRILTMDPDECSRCSLQPISEMILLVVLEVWAGCEGEAG